VAIIADREVDVDRVAPQKIDASAKKQFSVEVRKPIPDCSPLTLNKGSFATVFTCKHIHKTPITCALQWHSAPGIMLSSSCNLILRQAIQPRMHNKISLGYEAEIVGYDERHHSMWCDANIYRVVSA
jgi:hypothetical protein